MTTKSQKSGLRREEMIVELKIPAMTNRKKVINSNENIQHF